MQAPYRISLAVHDPLPHSTDVTSSRADDVIHPCCEVKGGALPDPQCRIP